MKVLVLAFFFASLLVVSVAPKNKNPTGSKKRTVVAPEWGDTLGDDELNIACGRYTDCKSDGHSGVGELFGCSSSPQDYHFHKDSSGNAIVVTQRSRGVDNKWTFGLSSFNGIVSGLTCQQSGAECGSLPNKSVRKCIACVLAVGRHLESKDECD